MKKTITYKRGRDARNGQYITIEEAKRRPSTTIVETVKLPKRY